MPSVLADVFSILGNFSGSEFVCLIVCFSTMTTLSDLICFYCLFLMFVYFHRFRD